MSSKGLRKRFDDTTRGERVLNRKSATIKDVADRAKVSISTVSHVINKTRNVETARRERVLLAIEELGYRPNQLARGLRGAGSKTIGLIISDISEDFFAELTKTIESAANESGFLVILCDSEEDPDKEARYLQILSERGVDGIILAPVDSRRPAVIPRSGKLPVVLVDRRYAGSSLDFVGIENVAATRTAVRHLVSLGHERLGFIGHESSISTMGERAEGFASALAEFAPKGQGWTLAIDSRGGSQAGKLKRWFQGHSELDAVLCGNANICFDTLETVEKLGLRVPEDLALVSFDDPRCFRFLRTPITAIRQPVRKMGTTALELLLAKTEGRGSASPAELLLPAKLIVRESCGASRQGG